MIDELLAPLSPTEPSDDEIRALLARADRRTRRRRIKVATATAFAAVAVTATLAALPGAEAPTGVPIPASAASLLKTTAAVAAEQPQPRLAPWTGFRYVQEIDTRTQDGYTIERTEEIWTDKDWQGRRISPEAKLVDGTIPPYHAAPKPPADVQEDSEQPPGKLADKAKKFLQEAAAVAKPDPKALLAARDIHTPDGMPNLYGDGPLARVPLSELPTDPDQLGK